MTIEDMKKNLSIEIKMDDVINYAFQQNRLPVIDEIKIKNSSSDEINDLMLKITSEHDLIDPFELSISKLEGTETSVIKVPEVKINGDVLASLTERITVIITVALYSEEEKVATASGVLTALAFDEWAGVRYLPEHLSAFVLPNHPVVTSFLQLSAQYMKKWTGDPSIEGYQRKDPNYIKMLAAAAYAAVQKKNIAYSNPPAHFEAIGQRVRLADAVLEQRLGTCLDMTVLYAAILEAMGLNPIMVLIKGHIFAGVWLVENTFPDSIMDDPSHLQKRMSKGINELLVVECTAMCAGKNIDFEKAVKSAENNVANYADFGTVIDVKRARAMGIRPLPLRIKTDAGFEVKHVDTKSSKITDAPEQNVQIFDFDSMDQKSKVTKQEQWERKLLDLTLRNMLINLRFTKALVPILNENVASLEDYLADGEEFVVLPKPDNMTYMEEEVPAEALCDLGPFKDYMEQESKHKRLHARYTEKELNSSLTKMYRSAKSSLEENGASTLYLAVGLLRWMETDIKSEARYAPILLLPVEIYRKAAGKGYGLRMRDEDTQLNITLLEFLKQVFDIDIKGLNPLPTDEHGLDVPKIFAIMRQNVLNKPGWDVVESAVLGNFSFSQFVMWNDIHSNSEKLEQNKVVRSLIKGAIDWDVTMPDNLDSTDAYLPITVDGSQLRAINMAAGDASFVLHGPPGTGKSQTITAMIANALTKGKTVLFVAEKRAALEVVEKRLDSLGIGDFCLELHSNKATKKAVLDQLKKLLELSAWGTRTDYNNKIEDIRKMRKELDAYVTGLHTKRPFGMSLRELIDIYETLPENEVILRFTSDQVRDITAKDLDLQRRAIEQMIAAGKTVGHPSAHPLFAIGQSNYTQTLKIELKDVLPEYKSAMDEFEASQAAFANATGKDVPVNKKDWEDLRNEAKEILQLEEGFFMEETIPSVLLESDNIDAIFSELMRFAAEWSLFSQRKEGILRAWKEGFLQQNMAIYQARYAEANKKLFGKNKAMLTLLDELRGYANITFTSPQIPILLNDVIQYQQYEMQMLAKKAQIPYELKEIIEAYPTEAGLNAYKNQIKEKINQVKSAKKNIEELGAASSWKENLEKAKAFIESSEKFHEKEDSLNKLLKLDMEALDQGWLQSRGDLCDSVSAHDSELRDWMVYRQYSDACRIMGLGVLCDAYESGMDHDVIINTYLKSLYRAIILSIIENEPALNGFAGSSFNELINQFKKLDAEFMELTKEEMYHILTHNLPSSIESIQIGKELNILRRAITSGGRGVTIRSLFDLIPNVLRRLAPCMLMSPISVAQYLSLNAEPYDVVVFDEASQLPTCKAVGVLARGKNAVIVGDPNQMPPTSFFAGNAVDEDNLDIEDLESILDDCLALGMPSAHLTWHYRSRHESLIAFSNREFYENSMLTFPSKNDRERCVRAVNVDGIFDRKKGRINEAEAKAVVEEIKKRYKDETLRDQSLGVVTFNISQQMAIEDLLQAEYAKDVEFDKWASSGDEPLFVKNLENVQGDERDVILFSVAYGPDEDGKVSMNFGPINREGGWKRLNVAVSRAKQEMIVFATLRSDQIDLRRTKSKGAEELKNFLSYAEKGNLPEVYSKERGNKNQGILNQICKALDEAGYKYQTGVGHSSFKVDIAVINPANEGEYILGILLDGDSYKNSKNTKDREVAQVSVLNGLGWKLHRVWAMDWWDNKQKEMKKILQLLAGMEAN